MQRVALLTFLLVSICKGSGVTILSPEEIAGDILTGPLQSFDFDITGELALAQIDCGKDFLNTEQYDGKIVLFTVALSDVCYRPLASYLNLAISWNATGCIIMESGGLVGYSVRIDNGDYKTSPLPSVTISQFEGDRIASYLRQSIPVEVHVTRPDVNPYTEFATGSAGIFFQFTMEFFGLLCTVAASWKLYGFVKAFGWEFSVTQTCLSLEIISCILRMIYGIDMQMFRFIWGPTTELFLSNIYMPISFAATLLIIFYWCDLMANLANYGAKLSRRLRNLRIPFIISASFLLIIVIIADSVRSAHVPMPLSSLLTAIVLAILCFILAVVFLVTGYKVLRPTIHSSDKKHFLLRRITWYFVGCGVALLIKSLDILIGVSALNATHPSSLLTYFWLTHMFAYLVTATQILAFQRPKIDKMSTSASSDKATVPMETINVSTSASITV